MIQYHRTSADEISVILEKRSVGRIRRVTQGWQYFPRGKSQGGEVFRTVAEVKASLESE